MGQRIQDRQLALLAKCEALEMQKLEDTLKRIHIHYGKGDFVGLCMSGQDHGLFTYKCTSCKHRHSRFTVKDGYVTLHGQKRKIGYKIR